MKILGASINWYDGFCNKPRLEIVVDSIPASFEELRYEQRGSLYFAEKDQYVSFFYYDGPSDGCGGHHFDIIMKDGTKKTLIGPWSSRCGVMNEAGFTPSVEVTIILEESYPYGRIAGAITTDLATGVYCMLGIVVEDIDEECRVIKAADRSNYKPFGLCKEKK